MKELFKDKYVINIDEAGFSKSVKTEYSWLPIGLDSSIINDVFQGRTNLILSVSQFGDWFGIIKDQTVTSFDYALFVKMLIKTLSCAGYDVQTQVTIIQD